MVETTPTTPPPLTTQSSLSTDDAGVEKYFRLTQRASLSGGCTYSRFQVGEVHHLGLKARSRTYSKF
ncbi:MAG: hypothetical protein RM021_002580 [Nostoc sp. EkiNYC01]|nr:hypothetical protein [Nostoc sp. EkiNYC01]